MEKTRPIKKNLLGIDHQINQIASLEEDRLKKLIKTILFYG